MSPAKSPSVSNRLLAALPKKDYQNLLRNLEEIPLVLGEIIYQPNAFVSDVYFPNSGIISLLAADNERATLEVGLVGKEGMVGLGVFLGVDSSLNRAVVQGVGSAMKMKSASFQKECSNWAFSRVLRRYSHSVLTQIQQAAVCNQFHSVNARLARWLLMTHDRMGDDEFQLTQEFLSNMLGVRREGVSKAASELQKGKMITYSRGRLKVLDRPGLEAASCSCYRIISDESRQV